MRLRLCYYLNADKKAPAILRWRSLGLILEILRVLDYKISCAILTTENTIIKVPALYCNFRALLERLVFLMTSNDTPATINIKYKKISEKSSRSIAANTMATAANVRINIKKQFSFHISGSPQLLKIR